MCEPDTASFLRPLRALAFCAAFLAAVPALASQPDVVCERAALQAAAESGVPADILGALTLTETGRRRGGVVRPWAWSVNAEGQGTWFDGPDAALGFARQRIAEGRTNLDIGCFQLNWRWHGEAFGSVAEMFDPLANARYAAGFLRRLHAETGDWRAAAGAFHSRSPDRASRYLARFDQLRAALQGRGIEAVGTAPKTYNSFAPVAGTDASARAAPRQRLTLLGAIPGSARAAGAGSLAVIGEARAPLRGLDGRRARLPASLAMTRP